MNGFPPHRRSEISRHFGVSTQRVGRTEWTLRMQDPTDTWRRVLSDPDAWLADPALHLKNSSNVTVARIPASAPGQPGLVLRRMNYGRWEHRLKDCFRRSRARRAFWRALALEGAGVQVAGVLATGEVRTLCWPRRAYLLSREIAGALTLDRYLALSGGSSRALELALSGVLARLHEAGFTHGDLKCSNILVAPDGQPWLIDFDGVRRHHQVAPGPAAEDLGRLASGIIEAGGACSRFRAVRFLSHYAAQRGTGDWRAYHRAAAKRARQKLEARATKNDRRVHTVNRTADGPAGRS